eukprot:6782163-Lingulodinium_polyedra.AAC.1
MHNAQRAIRNAQCTIRKNTNANNAQRTARNGQRATHSVLCGLYHALRATRYVVPSIPQPARCALHAARCAPRAACSALRAARRTLHA